MEEFFTNIFLGKLKWVIFYGWKPVIEIFVITVIIYFIASFIRGTRTTHLLKGLVIVLVIFFISQLLQLNTINWILTKIFAFSMIAFLIIFQPELRRVLSNLGQNTFFVNLLREEGMINEISKAMGILSKKKIGALVAIERNVGLRNYIESGIPMDCKITSETLIAIFMPTTPLHDGAVIIQGERIASSGCLLPLTDNPNISKAMGTRHRAAMGITEETDAITIVVSEETGTISIVQSGEIIRDLDVEALRRVLSKNLLQDTGGLKNDEA